MIEHFIERFVLFKQLFRGFLAHARNTGYVVGWVAAQGFVVDEFCGGKAVRAQLFEIVHLDVADAFLRPEHTRFFGHELKTVAVAREHDIVEFAPRGKRTEHVVGLVAFHAHHSYFHQRKQFLDDGKLPCQFFVHRLSRALVRRVHFVTESRTFEVERRGDVRGLLFLDYTQKERKKTVNRARIHALRSFEVRKCVIGAVNKAVGVDQEQFACLVGHRVYSLSPSASVRFDGSGNGSRRFFRLQAFVFFNDALGVLITELFEVLYPFGRESHCPAEVGRRHYVSYFQVAEFYSALGLFAFGVGTHDNHTLAARAGKQIYGHIVVHAAVDEFLAVDDFGRENRETRRRHDIIDEFAFGYIALHRLKRFHIRNVVCHATEIDVASADFLFLQSVVDELERVFVRLAYDFAGGKQLFARGDDEVEVEILLFEPRHRFVVEIEHGTILRFFPIPRQFLDALRGKHRTVKRAYGSACDCVERITVFQQGDDRAQFVRALDAAAFQYQTDPFVCHIILFVCETAASYIIYYVNK